MKVQIKFTIDIDTDAWTSNYGVEGAAAIREDVRAYAEDAAWDQFKYVGVLADLSQ